MPSRSEAIAGRGDDANISDQRSLSLFKSINVTHKGKNKKTKREPSFELLLSENGVDPNIKNEAGHTLLSRAVVLGRHSAVQLLLNHDKIDLDCKDEDGRTPLSRAAELGDQKTIQLLLEQKQRQKRINLDAKVADKQTPLLYAAGNGHEGIVKQLLDSGEVDANMTDPHGLTALGRAARGNKKEVIKVMLDYGGIDFYCTDKEGQNILSQAVERGCLETVELLLNRHIIDPESEDMKGETPLFRTIRHSWNMLRGDRGDKWFMPNDHPYQRIPRLLLKHGVDLNKKDKSARTILSRAAESGHEPAVTWLLDQEKVDVNSTDNHDRTPLFWAVEGGHEPIVRLLLQKSTIDPNPIDMIGHTPLSRALHHGYKNITKLIVPKDRVTLHLYTQRGDLDLVTRLVEAKYNLKTRDSMGREPLHIAALFGQLGIAKHLVLAQSDINAEDVNGMTALRFAVQRKHTEIANMLLQHSAETTGINSGEWFDLYDKTKAPDTILELSQLPSGHKTMCVVNQSQVRMTVNSELARRLLLFSNCLIWAACLDQDTRNILNSNKISMKIHKKIDDQAVSFFMTAWSPRYSGNEDQFMVSEEKWCIAWTIVPPMKTKNVLSWKSIDHWSNLSLGWIPDSGANFFTVFIQTLKGRWLAVCSLGQVHLSSRRLDQLKEKGRNPEMINYLAEDAQSWARLRGILQKQIQEARSFSEEYSRVYDQDNGPGVMQRSIDTFADEVSSQISQLEQTVKDLLQFEFAWVSINEAYRSTSIAKSIKRLSWITFIFLPAMFASSLFGMNVNILASNPDWRWYLLFGGGFIALTGFGWLLFKYGKVETWVEEHIGARLQRWSDGTGQRKGDL